VLVAAGEEFDPPAVEPHEAGQHIAGQRRIGMAEMRQIVDVVDRRRDEIRSLGGHDPLPAADMAPNRSRFYPCTRSIAKKVLRIVCLRSRLRSSVRAKSRPIVSRNSA